MGGARWLGRTLARPNAKPADPRVQAFYRKFMRFVSILATALWSFAQNSIVLKQRCCILLVLEVPMIDYTSKSYGRNDEVASIYRHFAANRDVSMAGPRRLGKTFVLDRVIEAGPAAGWTAVKVDVAGCGDPRAFFRNLCNGIGSHRSAGPQAVSWIMQRAGQIFSPRGDHAGEWYQPLLSLDHETYFERLIKALHEDTHRRWALLVDELPIFLKALHDDNSRGTEAARNFMNLTSRLRAQYPRVRWLITGSIGLTPLARAGNYMGVLAKYESFNLQPLSRESAKDFLQDIARDGGLLHRSEITDVEAEALVEAVGWRAAYYLEALAKKLAGHPTHDAPEARRLVDTAVAQLLAPGEEATFGVWEEHIRKHYHGHEGSIAFAVLAALAPHAAGRSLAEIWAALAKPQLAKETLCDVVKRLDVEGFLTVSDWDSDDPEVAFLNPLLRAWWKRFTPREER